MALHGPIFEYLRETLCRRAWGYLEPAALKNKWEKMFLLTEKTLTIIDLLKDCDGWGHVFAASASSRS